MDLAADHKNKKAHYYIGEQTNSLEVFWLDHLNALCNGLDTRSNVACWLNPPFKGVGPWMEKCALESGRGLKIITLTLAALGTQWYQKYVEPNAQSFILRDRITFDGCDAPFNKECMISLWGFDMKGLSFWKQGVA